MTTAFPDPSPVFVGRDDIVTRFRARLEHFRLFVYEGAPGIGTTELLLRLASATEAVGCTGALYLRLYPGESITSILARVEARCGETAAQSAAAAAAERQGDPFTRLIDVLSRHQLVLLLDELQHVQREDLPALVRALKNADGPYRVVAATHEEPGLSAMDLMLLHHERVGPLTTDEVGVLLEQVGASAPMRDALLADVARNGAAAHPLTLRFILAGFKEPPPATFLAQHSCRSVMAFKSLFELEGVHFTDKERWVLAGLGQLGVPIDKELATQVFGSVLGRLAKAGLLTQVAGEVSAHHLVGQVLQGPALDAEAEQTIATHLETRGRQYSEPMALIRAGELLAHAGLDEQAVETLASGWESVRDLGFLEAYLKSLAAIGESADKASLRPRLQLLAARARMRQGKPQSVVTQMQRLAEETDRWTRTRALAALAYIRADSGEHQAVVDAYEALKKAKPDNDLLVAAGALAAEAYVRLERVEAAEKLAKQLLTSLRNKNQPEVEGELRRLLAKIYAQSAQLAGAVKEAQKAAQAFEKAGDLYHAATAHGFIGDLYRETGEFEHAKTAFARFHELATQWGERDLVQIAELANAWVSLDIGDIASGAKQVAEVEKEMSAAPSRRLKRYLAAAKALLEAGRGRHTEAARALGRVVEAWEEAGQYAIADILRAHRVRSLLASGKVDEARSIVDAALSRLDPKNAALRLATFTRESALINLRRANLKQAMSELDEACRLFSEGGNRREEVLTLYRIAHAALEQGDLELAEERAKDASKLARRIRHARAVALSDEVSGRVALANDAPKEAATLLKRAMQGLRKLGDELGTLHVSEALLRAHLVAGDLAAALRLGPRVAENAERLEIPDVRVRAIVLTGVALLRRGKHTQARKCFRELAEGTVSPFTTALMWRYGEALAALDGSRAQGLERRARWVDALASLPEERQIMSLNALEQLMLPPRDQAELRTHEETTLVSTEESAWLEPSDFDLFVDVLNRRVYSQGKRVSLKPKDNPGLAKLLFELVIAAPKPLTYEQANQILTGEKFEGKVSELQKAVRAQVKDLQTLVKAAKHIKITAPREGVKLTLPSSYALLIPTTRATADLSGHQRRILKLLRRLGTAPLQTLQQEFSLSRAAARREVSALIESGLVEAVRDGRGQAFRLL